MRPFFLLYIVFCSSIFKTARLDAIFHPWNLLVCPKWVKWVSNPKDQDHLPCHRYSLIKVKIITPAYSHHSHLNYKWATGNIGEIAVISGSPRNEHKAKENAKAKTNQHTQRILFQIQRTTWNEVTQRKEKSANKNSHHSHHPKHPFHHHHLIFEREPTPDQTADFSLECATGAGSSSLRGWCSIRFALWEKTRRPRWDLAYMNRWLSMFFYLCC